MKDRLESYVNKGGKKLRYGYTTGTCAALAAQGAATALLSGETPSQVRVMTPKGIEVVVSHLEWEITEDHVTCGVEKDGGDDIDATHGTMIYATVSKEVSGGIFLEGGTGIGRVTRKGLDQPVGASAINRVPREMILREVEEVREAYHFDGGLRVILSVPEGEEIAKRTFNSQLGIVGGISILGTSGIVEPQSVAALLATIEAEIKMLTAEGHSKIIGVPGNYGEDFLKTYPQLRGYPVVKYSNFLGEFLDFAVDYQLEQLLLVGHIGKMVKVAGGIMNTHSRYGDCRREIFAAYAGAEGGSTSLIRKLLSAATSDECLTYLKEAQLDQQVLQHLLGQIDFYTNRRTLEQVQVGTVIFSNQHGLLGISPQGKQLIEGWTI